MPKKRSAGILLYRRRQDAVQVLVGHMGGPFWAHKDEGAWSIPKGEYSDGEDAFAVALREFEEELGVPVPADEFVELGVFRQPSGKLVTVWAAEGDLDASACVSNTFEMEWPKGSGRIIDVPEIDRAEWFDVAVSRR
jgi:predicted NUDIX family NTP pyrophosphohydrolase